jgi:hypothetical protein
LRRTSWSTQPLVAALYATEEGAPVLLTRWRFSEEGRARIAAGEDLYLAVTTFGKPLQPLAPQIGAEGYEVPPTEAA